MASRTTSADDISIGYPHSETEVLSLDNEDDLISLDNEDDLTSLDNDADLIFLDNGADLISLDNDADLMYTEAEFVLIQTEKDLADKAKKNRNPFLKDKVADLIECKIKTSEHNHDASRSTIPSIMDDDTKNIQIAQYEKADADPDIEGILERFRKADSDRCSKTNLKGFKYSHDLCMKSKASEIVKDVNQNFNAFDGNQEIEAEHAKVSDFDAYDFPDKQFILGELALSDDRSRHIDKILEKYEMMLFKVKLLFFRNQKKDKKTNLEMSSENKCMPTLLLESFIRILKSGKESEAIYQMNIRYIIDVPTSPIWSKPCNGNLVHNLFMKIDKIMDMTKNSPFRAIFYETLDDLTKMVESKQLDYSGFIKKKKELLFAGKKSDPLIYEKVVKNLHFSAEDFKCFDEPGYILHASNAFDYIMFFFVYDGEYYLEKPFFENVTFFSKVLKAPIVKDGDLNVATQNNMNRSDFLCDLYRNNFTEISKVRDYPNEEVYNVFIKLVQNSGYVAESVKYVQMEFTSSLTEIAPVEIESAPLKLTPKSKPMDDKIPAGPFPRANKFKKAKKFRTFSPSQHTKPKTTRFQVNKVPDTKVIKNVKKEIIYVGRVSFFYNYPIYYEKIIFNDKKNKFYLDPELHSCTAEELLENVRFHDCAPKILVICTSQADEFGVYEKFVKLHKRLNIVIGGNISKLNHVFPQILALKEHYTSVEFGYKTKEQLQFANERLKNIAPVKVYPTLQLVDSFASSLPMIWVAIKNFKKTILPNMSFTRRKMLNLGYDRCSYAKIWSHHQ
uniref:RING-type domain-containing protein n=1 Tax=Rhabditophanes sp. KR3021 TaxID=114890 RepID=A0AC35TXF1_9BILA